MFPLYDNIQHSRLPWVVIVLIALNIYGMLWLHRLPQPQQQLVVLTRGFIPARVGQLRTHKPLTINIPALARVPHLGFLVQVNQALELQPAASQIIYAAFSAMFLHAGWWHLIGNMWFLWVFGDNVEDRIGHVSFLILYVVGGLCAWMCHWWIEPNSMIPVIGASGAVSAVLGAYLVSFPKATFRTVLVLGIFITLVDVSALILLGIYFIIQLLEGTRALQLGVGGGVAWFAHVGGFVAGVILMKLMTIGMPPPQYGKFEEKPPDEETGPFHLSPVKL